MNKHPQVNDGYYYNFGRTLPQIFFNRTKFEVQKDSNCIVLNFESPEVTVKSIECTEDRPFICVISVPLYLAQKLNEDMQNFLRQNLLDKYKKLFLKYEDLQLKIKMALTSLPSALCDTSPEAIPIPQKVEIVENQSILQTFQTSEKFLFFT